MNFLDTTFMVNSEECYNITEERLEERKKQANKHDRLEILIQMDEASKERLGRREFLTYSRRNKAFKISIRAANIVLENWVCLFNHRQYSNIVTQP
jgi:hypothetical protein